MMAKQPEYEIEDWEQAYNKAKTQEERDKAVDDYSAAKLRNAERREQYRLDRASERFDARIAKFQKATSKIKMFWHNLLSKFSSKTK